MVDVAVPSARQRQHLRPTNPILPDLSSYEPSTLDLIRAYQHLTNAAAKCDRQDWAQAEVDRLIAKRTSSDRQVMLLSLLAEHERQP